MRITQRIFRGSEDLDLILWLHQSFREETLGFVFNQCNWNTVIMPSTKKTLHFISSALATSISVGLIGYGMSTKWVITTMECAEKASGLYNGSAEITLALFDGILARSSCPFFGATDTFQGNFQKPRSTNQKQTQTTMFSHISPQCWLFLFYFNKFQSLTHPTFKQWGKFNLI